MEPLVLDHRPSYILPRAAGSLVFVLLGFVLLALEPPELLVTTLGGSAARLVCVVVSLLVIVFFSFAAVRTVQLGRGHALRVDETGIDNRTNAVCVRHVPWEQIAGFHPLRVRMGVQDIDSVQIEFVDPQWPMTQVRGLRALAVRANESMAGFGPGSISTDPLDVSPEVIQDCLDAHLQRRRRESGRDAGPHLP